MVGTLTERASEGFAMGTYESLRWSSDGRRGALLASGVNAIYVWFIAPDGARSAAPLARGIVASTGCNDVAWGADGFGDPTITVVCGTNTAQVLTASMVDSGAARWTTPVSPGEIGNIVRIATRPQGDVSLSVGTSSSRLYRVRGSVWEAGFFAPTLRGIYSVAWATDGRRALAFGGNGFVYEYRHDLYSMGELTSASFAPSEAPWTQPSSAVINDLAWRPGCDEGVAVGGSSSITGATAFVAPFRLAGARPCGM